MQKKTWVRLGLASMLVGVASAGFYGCSSDDTSTPAGTDTTSGTSTTTSTSTSGGTSTSTGTTTGTTTTSGTSTGTSTGTGNNDWAKINLLHAAAGLGPVRACLRVGTLDYGNAAPADKPIPPGAGGAFPAPADPAALAFDIFLVKEAAAADATTHAAKKCADIMKDATLKLNTDYFKAGRIKSGDLPHKSSSLLAFTGCPGGFAGGAAKCGSDYDATNGNVAMKKVALDIATTPDSAKISGQFFHASSEAAAAQVPVGVDPDAGTPILAPIFAGGLFAAIVSPPAPSDAGAPEAGVDAAAPVPMLTPIGTGPYKFGDAPAALTGATALTGIALGVPDPNNGGKPKWIKNITLDQVAIASTGDATMTGAKFFKTGVAYTFIAVGDPTVTYDPTSDATKAATAHFFRVIALTNLATQ